MHAVPHQQGRGRAQVLQTHVTHVTASAAADRYDCLVCTAVGCSLTLLPAASSAAQAALPWQQSPDAAHYATSAAVPLPAILAASEQEPSRCQATASGHRLPNGSLTTPDFSAQHARCIAWVGRPPCPAPDCIGGCRQEAVPLANTELPSLPAGCPGTKHRFRRGYLHML